MKELIEMQKEIDEILGYDQRECGKIFYPETGTFDDWHKVNKLRAHDSIGKHKGSSQMYWRWYQADVECGFWKDTPYCDFWHWMIDNCFGDEFRNDSEQEMYLGDDVKFEYDWQKVIYKAWQDKYKHLCGKDDCITVSVCW